MMPEKIKSPAGIAATGGVSSNQSAASTVAPTTSNRIATDTAVAVIDRRTVFTRVWPSSWGPATRAAIATHVVVS